MKCFFDTETVGLYGPCALIQYAFDDDSINLHSPWYTPVRETLDVIESMINCDLIGFNLSFDMFHLAQMYTTLYLFDDWDSIPIDCIDEYALREKQARDLDLCLKPKRACDLLLWARKGRYQNTLDRDDIRIKRVPTALANHLCAELDRRIPINDIYFAKKQDKKKRWQVMDILNDFGEVVPDLKDVVLKFAPSSALKALAVDALGYKDATVFSEISLPEKVYPIESGYAPYALAPFYPEGYKEPVFPSPKNWYGKWPDYINIHASHWAYNEQARKYAEDDVKYTRELFKFFKITDEEMDDDDSVLACQVASVRWRGFRVNLDAIRKLKEDTEKDLANQPNNFNSQEVCKKYLYQVLSSEEQMVMQLDGKFTTKGTILEELAKWTVDSVCDQCNGAGCPSCDAGIRHSDTPHPAALRAQEILDSRHAKLRISLYDKFLLADRFHASFNIIGARSGRMSGSDGLNAQGINASKIIRSCFPLAWEGQTLEGGDLAGSQVAIAAAVFKDPQMGKDLREKKICPFCNGAGCGDCDNLGYHYAKIYAIFGQCLFPGMSYDDIYKTKGAKVSEKDLYKRSKSGFLAMIFGGEAYTLQNRVGISEAAANDGFQKFLDRYPAWNEERKKYVERFCSMTQPKGIGTKVEWKDPADYIESIFGFRRYFNLENQVCKALFELANDIPKEWLATKIRVMRRDREQTASGAIRSALYASAFAVQAGNMRAAANHVIQSPEATIVKCLQRRIWNLQPCGIHPWQVMPANIHDEIMCPARPELATTIRGIVDETIEEYKKYIPLMAIDWSSNLKSWADK